MKRIIYIMSLLVIPFIGIAQEESNSYSLQEAIEFAKEHNYDLINAHTDIEIAEKKVWETTAIGLPQIDGVISNENFIDIPTTLMPDFISPAVYGVNEGAFGLTPINPFPDDPQFFAVTFGTKHNATAGVDVSQLLFSGEYIVGLQASKAFLGQTEKQKVQTEVILVEQVSKSYFLILSLQDNLEILKSSLDLNKILLDETTSMFAAGFLEDTDVDQLDVIVSTLEASIRNVENEIVTAISFLKFYMGHKNEIQIELTDNISQVINHLDIEYLLQSKFDENENIDFLLFMQQKELANLQLKRDQSTYLPSINAFFSAKTNAMRDSYNFFDTKERWYPTTVWGFQMNIPIFSSGQRRAVIQQSKLNLKKMGETQKQLSSSLQLQVQTARNKFSNQYYEYLNRKKTLKLTSKIYNKTQTKYKEGMASSFDLNQAQNSFIQSNTEYTMSIMNLLQNKIELEKFLTRTANLFEE